MKSTLSLARFWYKSRANSDEIGEILSRTYEIPFNPSSYVSLTDSNSPLSDPYEYNYVSAKELLSEQAWSAFPNPASQWAQVDGDFDVADFSLELRTTAGSLVLWQQNQKTMDVSALPSDFYLLHLHTNNGVGVRKLIVSK
ncbi:MAG: T9SS type A sorting domain-containing protein [Saprospiraceae bacterium]|nr:T9SS type A sorting domain-containing protein [Saprospiraceae bacterium]